MSSEKTLERELAERVREAVRRATPATFPESEGTAGPDALRRAEDHLTPSIPDGAPLAGAKSAVIRVLRFLWREQAAFNALALEALRDLRRDLSRFRETTDRELAETRRRARIQDARFALLEAPDREGGGGETSPSPAPSVDPIPAAVYSLFEERFRGSPESIAASQRPYVEFLRGAPGPVLDVGCGRGEFLRLLAAEGIEASGLESSPIAVRLCREAGLAVEEGDALRHLARRPRESLGGVVALQVVEHWTAAETFRFLAEARRTLRPGGALVAETINTDSLSALHAYFLDPTHVRPVPPQALAFLAEAAGFGDVSIVYRSPLPAEERLVEVSENDAKLNRLLFGPQDYAILARRIAD